MQMCVYVDYTHTHTHTHTHAQSCPALCDPTDCSQPGFSPQDFPGKNTGVGCRFLLQGIFPAQGSNLSLASPALARGFFTTELPKKPHIYIHRLTQLYQEKIRTLFEFCI